MMIVMMMMMMMMIIIIIIIIIMILLKTKTEGARGRTWSFGARRRRLNGNYSHTDRTISKSLYDKVFVLETWRRRRAGYMDNGQRCAGSGQSLVKDFSQTEWLRSNFRGAINCCKSGVKNPLAKLWTDDDRKLIR
ncbi:hypothetical protein ElyMa_005284600 [Elysia marginata]|uniref:Secreted protein n=1 Tax=Elysia marginata TaxID=1093978 RepID=A0AAV4K433_9GAST|nr:hypothetical protein ElyMa_005284600 [Elysia marginata]